jgi:RNA recognition motif-containing protein
MKEFKKIGYYSKDEHVSTLYISGISYKRTEKDLKKIFENYGKVGYVKVVVDFEKERSKGIAFVQMNNANHAKAAVKALNNTIRDGRTFKVEITTQKNIKNINTAPKSKESTVQKENSVQKPPMRRRDKKRMQGLGKLFDHLAK